jgi:hypothetical protein
MMDGELTLGDFTTDLFDDEPRIADWRLAEALHFTHERHIRELIERHCPSLERFGTLSYRATKSTGGRPGTEYRLNFNQAIFIVIKSEAPRAVPVQIHVVTIYGLWATGKLQPIDADTSDQINEATAEAINQTPELLDALKGLRADTGDIGAGVNNANVKLDYLEKYFAEHFAELQRSFDENVRQPRVDELSSVRWQQDYTVAEHLDCWCPICRRIKILTVIERSTDGRVTGVEKTDHYEHAHLLVRTVRGLFNTMPMCRQCNQTWERKLRHKEWVVERVRSFHRLLREAWGILDLEET